MPKLLIVAFFLFFTCLAVSAQKKKEDDLTSYFPTRGISFQNSAMPANAPVRKDYSVIYKPDAFGILYGNPCAVEATMKMGFIYTVNVDGIPGSVTGFKKFLNNAGVNLKLIFTRSPFWKLILNQKIKKCRQLSGDFVG
ncbi:MAG: hypothetical protein RIA69_04380 [Cyclobacteriaceae bacterium]